MKEFKDKIAVVTGAASGIGRGMAESFAAAGMKVVLSDIEAPALAKTAESLRAAGADVHTVATDVSQPAQVEALAKATLERFGAVHVLCNNAGIAAGGQSTWTSTLDGLQPRAVGDQVLAAIRAERFYILTHPEMLPLIQKRASDILSGGNPSGMPITVPSVPAAGSARS